MMTTSEQIAPDHTAATDEQLEQEGDIAADFLEGLLDIADIDGDLPTPFRRCRSSRDWRCRTRPVVSRG
jgi:spoIIIJ-associated protein